MPVSSSGWSCSTTCAMRERMGSGASGSASSTKSSSPFLSRKLDATKMPPRPRFFDVQNASNLSSPSPGTYSRQGSSISIRS
jgi:hypothetical protein